MAGYKVTINLVMEDFITESKQDVEKRIQLDIAALAELLDRYPNAFFLKLSKFDYELEQVSE